MNKLQLYITKSYGGYKVVFNINPSEEVTRHIRELRNEVRKVKYDASEKNIFFFVTNTAGGTFVTIIRTIPSSPADHLAAWIYIPNELIIDAQALESIVNVTMRKITADKITKDDVDSLRDLFSTEYMTDPEAPLMTASKQGNQIGWRAYNGDTGVTLRDLLGKGLFQVPYLDYSGVMFVDADLDITVQGADLTRAPIMGPAVVMPAERSPENFIAHVFGHAADKPIRVTIDTNIPVVWKHPGFEDVVDEQVIDSLEFVPPIPDTSMSTKEISSASFQILPQAGTTPLKECKITVNGYEVSAQPHRFTTAELTSAKVVVNSEGYTTHSGTMNLAATTRAMIRLQERTKIFNFEMPVKSADLGAPVRFKIFSKKPLVGSPLEGYVTTEPEILEGETRMNHLVYVPTATPLSEKLIYSGIGLLVGLIFGWLTACGGGSDDKKSDDKKIDETEQTAEAAIEDTDNADGLDNNTIAKLNSLFEYTPTKPEIVKPGTQEQPKEEPQEKVETEDMSQVTAKSIAYLDNNKSWTKEDLEQLPGLAGLYDDLNNFNLERLNGEWAEKLKGSKAFTNLTKFVKNGMVPSKRDKCLAKGSTFNDANTTKISVQSYTFRIDP